MQKHRIWLVAAVAWTLALAGGSTSAAEHEHTLTVGKNGDVTFTQELKSVI